MSASMAKLMFHLTDREIDVARLYATGLTLAAVGAELGISGKTAFFHLARFNRNTNTSGAAQVARWVITNLESHSPTEVTHRHD
jgi:DNA-binding CsgD family transcriptional regulator